MFRAYIRKQERRIIGSIVAQSVEPSWIDSHTAESRYEQPSQDERERALRSCHVLWGRFKSVFTLWWAKLACSNDRPETFGFVHDYNLVVNRSLDSSTALTSAQVPKFIVYLGRAGFLPSSCRGQRKMFNWPAPAGAKTVGYSPSSVVAILDPPWGSQKFKLNISRVRIRKTCVLTADLNRRQLQHLNWRSTWARGPHRTMPKWPKSGRG